MDGDQSSDAVLDISEFFLPIERVSPVTVVSDNAVTTKRKRVDNSIENADIDIRVEDLESKFGKVLVLHVLGDV